MARSLFPVCIQWEFELNQIFFKRVKYVLNDVFETGSTFERVTKGIWIYIKLEKERNLAFVYIDVEGFGDPKQANVTGKNNRLLMVVSQICDVIMYNTKGVPDDSMLQKLGLVCNMFDKHRKQDQVLSKPILVVLLRDYELDGLCSDQSFRDMLLNYAGGNCANEAFRDIKYVELVKPKEGKNIRDLQNIPDKELEEEFVEKRGEVERFIHMEAKPLSSKSGNNLTGKVLTEVVRKTVQAVNRDSFQGLEQTLPDILKQHNERKMQEALQMFEKQMKTDWPATNADALETLADVQKCTKETTKEGFQNKLFDIDKATLQEDFEIQTQTIFATISKTKSEAELKKINLILETGLKDKSYEIIGGHEKYCREKQSVKEKYTELKNLGPEKEDLWKKYEEKLNLNEVWIKEKDEMLSQVDEARRKQSEAEKAANSWATFGKGVGIGVGAATAAVYNFMKFTDQKK
ncbi:guanylate-binding protein 5-like [Mercenaria mercenaria]|uniref:guanylate-binding protein 5-like n=1 Tax=Mercenaria mercenaria TaxID=6596 RepID=UPI00234E4B48|nr:guanylate-binding protein 5-like [Mercenaria mercenaria]